MQPGSMTMANGPPSGGMMRPPGPMGAPPGPPGMPGMPGAPVYGLQQAAAGMQQMSLGGPPGPPGAPVGGRLPLGLLQCKCSAVVLACCLHSSIPVCIHVNSLQSSMQWGVIRAVCTLIMRC